MSLACILQNPDRTLHGSTDTDISTKNKMAAASSALRGFIMSSRVSQSGLMKGN